MILRLHDMEYVTRGGLPDHLTGTVGIELIWLLCREDYRAFAFTLVNGFDWDRSSRGKSFWLKIYEDADSIVATINEDKGEWIKEIEDEMKRINIIS